MRAFKRFVMTVAGMGLLGSAAQATPLRVAVEGDGDYAPFSFFDANKTLTGFDIEITKALCKQIPEGCEIIPVNWEVIIDGLASGKYDASVASMAYTKERAAKMLYGPLYYRSHSIFIGRPEKFTATTPEALKGARLTSSQGTVQQEFLTSHYKQSTIVEGKDFSEAYAKLGDGSVDLVLGDAVVLMDFLQSKAGADFGFVGDPIKDDAVESAAYVTLRKGMEPAAHEFQDAFDHIRLDGTYDRINRSFVPFSIY